MKKFTTIFCMMALICSFCYFGIACSCQDENTIRLNEVTHSIFYAPLYVAITEGFFEEQGLKIELTNGGGADKSMSALLGGDADIGLMGPEACIYVNQQGSKDAPKVFGQLTKKDGSFLMGKTAIENFTWDDLRGKEVIGGRRGGVPAMVLEYAMKQGGLHPGNALGDGVDTILNLDVQFNLVASSFESKEDAFCTMFEPTASEYQDSGRGYIIASMGELSGEIPYTAFMAKSSYIEKNRDKVKKFLTAIVKGYNYIINTNLDEVASSLLPQFPGTSKESIKKALQSYIDIDAWNSSPVMQESALDKLQEIIMQAGELTKKSKFTDIVDNSIAQEVMEQFA